MLGGNNKDATIQQLNSQINQLNYQLNLQQNYYENEKHQLTSENSRLKNENLKLKNENDDAKSELENENTALINENIRLRDTIDRNQEEKEKLKAEILRLKHRVNNGINKISELQTKITELQATVIESQNESKQLRDRIEQTKTEKFNIDTSLKDENDNIITENVEDTNDISVESFNAEKVFENAFRCTKDCTEDNEEQKIIKEQKLQKMKNALRCRVDTNAEFVFDKTNIEEIRTEYFNKQAIVDLQKKLNSKIKQPDTEEATKQWFIVPLLVALGYDPYSSDIIPEYTLDVGVKKGEKVDYALQINNQPVVIIECKQLDTPLCDKHISQLYRYFAVSDVRIAILTNGDDYWFFTDSIKENIMDLEPYDKIQLSTANTEDLDKFEQYSKSSIQYVDVAKAVQCERKEEKTQDKKSSLGNRMKATMDENRKNISKIKLNHEYVYNDYSDGDWKFHAIDYAIILGNKYENMSGKLLLVYTLTELLKQRKIDKNKILKEDMFNGTYKISNKGDFRGAYYLVDYNIYVSTSYSIENIIRFINKLLTYANLPDNSIKISFKS